MPGSVAICTVRPNHLLQTIRAVCAQTYSDFELIVVDQSHASAIKDIVISVKDSRIKHVQDSGIGLNRARNLALKEASYDVIAFTDDDCTPCETWLESLLQRYSEESDLCFLGGPLTKPKDFRPEKLGICPANKIDQDELWRNYSTIPDSSSVYQVWGGNISYNRRLLLNRIGWFDVYFDPGAKFGMCGDDDMRRRILEKGMTVGTCTKAIVEHSYGERTGRAYLRHVRTSAYALGALHAKYKLLSQPIEPLLRMDGPNIELESPIRSVRKMIRHSFMQQGFKDCLEHFTVDHGRRLLIPKGSRFSSVYDFVGPPEAICSEFKQGVEKDEHVSIS